MKTEGIVAAQQTREVVCRSTPCHCERHQIILFCVFSFLFTFTYCDDGRNRSAPGMCHKKYSEKKRKETKRKKKKEKKRKKKKKKKKRKKKRKKKKKTKKKEEKRKKKEKERIFAQKMLRYDNSRFS